MSRYTEAILKLELERATVHADNARMGESNQDLIVNNTALVCENDELKARLLAIRQLLTDLEAWRAYLRILLGRMAAGGTLLEAEAFKAFIIEDDRLALTLNKSIGEK